MRPLLLTLPLALALAGCSASLDKADPSPTATATATASASATPTPSVPASVTPSPTATRTPVPTRVKPALDGDIDGDGKVDAVKTTATVLTVVLSGSQATLTAPINSEAPRGAPVLGSKDVDRDGYAELFLQTAQGASTQFATPYRYDGTVLRELKLEGEPARLGIGGSVTHGEGFRCTAAGQLELRRATSDDGLAFSMEIITYKVVADELIEVSRRTATGKQGDREVEASYSVDCGSVGEGG